MRCLEIHIGFGSDRIVEDDDALLNDVAVAASSLDIVALTDLRTEVKFAALENGCTPQQNGIGDGSSNTKISGHLEIGKIVFNGNNTRCPNPDIEPRRLQNSHGLLCRSN